MRTQGAFFSDTAHGGSFVFYGPGQIVSPAAATVFPWTRNAAGDVSLNGPTPPAAGANYFWLSMANMKRQIETAALARRNMPFQQRFGNAASGPGWPAGAPGLPPFADTTQFTPPTADTPKGIHIIDIYAVYSVQTAALTAATLAMYRTVYADSTALAVTTVVAPATIATTISSAANAPFVGKVAVAAPAGFETTDLSNVLIELTLTTAATTVLRVYGMGCHFNFNWD